MMGYTVMHIITGLNNGGAEGVLYRLCMFDKNNKHIVVSLMDEGKYGSLLKEQGIQVYCLNMARGHMAFKGLRVLYSLIRQYNPDVVQTWMYHADFIGGIISRLAGIKKVFWGIRHSTFQTGKSKKTTMLLARLLSFLSHFVPAGIICCADQARLVHEKIGYSSKKMVVIKNGYDLTRFYPDEEKRHKNRNVWGIGDNENLIGIVGRFDPQKDHFNLISALSLLDEALRDFKVVMIGENLVESNTDLTDALKKANIFHKTLLLGPSKDIPDVMNALDLHVLSSAYGEAFPNVVAEAMACGVPCIATDVGDSQSIIESTGWVVPPSDAEALSKAISEALIEKKTRNFQWQNRKILARKKIESNYDIYLMVSRYHETWN